MKIVVQLGSAVCPPERIFRNEIWKDKNLFFPKVIRSTIELSCRSSLESIRATSKPRVVVEATFFVDSGTVATDSWLTHRTTEGVAGAAPNKIFWNAQIASASVLLHRRCRTHQASRKWCQRYIPAPGIRLSMPPCRSLRQNPPRVLFHTARETGAGMDRRERTSTDNSSSPSSFCTACFFYSVSSRPSGSVVLISPCEGNGGCPSIPFVVQRHTFRGAPEQRRRSLPSSSN